MTRTIGSAMLVVTLLGGLLVVSGCETEAQNKAMWGTAIGAGAGQLIGRDTKSTLIGAGIGAGAGYLIGNEQDKSRQRQTTAPAQTETRAAAGSADSETIWITNSNGSQTPVRLTRDGAAYIGPRGERYATRPTEDQLRKVYGF